MGEYATENVFNLESLNCRIYDDATFSTPSRVFEKIKFNTLNDMQIRTKAHVSGNLNPQFYLRCTGFKNPNNVVTGGIFKPIKAYLDSSDDTNTAVRILSSNELSLPTFTAESPNVYETTITKNFISPGSNFELGFNMKISKMDLTETSRIIIVFPSYYLA